MHPVNLNVRHLMDVSAMLNLKFNTDADSLLTP